VTTEGWLVDAEAWELEEAVDGVMKRGAIGYRTCHIELRTKKLA